MKTIWISFCKATIPSVMDGTKTLTSRVIKPQPLGQVTSAKCWLDGFWRIEHEPAPRAEGGDFVGLRIRCPYGQPGDLLKVKEGYQITGVTGNENGIIGRYLADDMPFQVNLSDAEAVRFKMRKYPTRATSGRFMYASLCRTMLVNRGVTVARVQDITPLDCEAEGITGKTLPTPCVGGIWLPYEEYRNGDGLVYGTPRDAFAALWDSINAKRGFPFSENPWVWKVGFEVKE